jgi:predicted MFS family arabinose efflux permease
VSNSTRDVKLLFLQRFFRLFAYGTTFIILVHFLSSLGISDEHIGLFMTLTMLGDVVISFVLTLITDQVGRRRVLLVGAALMILSGAVFSLSSSYWILVLASVVGVISPRRVRPLYCEGHLD